MSPYLKALREEGLIDYEDGEGRRRYYRLKASCRKIVEVIKGAQELQKTPINEEEFDRLLNRALNPETQDLALEGLRDMISQNTLKSDRPIKKVYNHLKCACARGKDVDVPLKMVRLFSHLCYEGRKEGLLDDKLISEIAYYALGRIRDDSVTKEVKTDVRDLWINLDTMVGSNEILEYCINYAQKELELKYKEEEVFIRDTLKNTLRNEEMREKLRQKLWKLIEEEKDETIINRYKTFLRFDVGLYKGALSYRM